MTVTVGEHPVFRREGLDILVDVPITIAEAALGVSVEVSMLQGTVQIKIPPGASSGRKLRVPKKGIVDAKDRCGHFYAVVQIVAPQELSDKAAGLLTELSAELKNPRDSGTWASSE